jgi:hypothetical protein
MGGLLVGFVHVACSDTKPPTGPDEPGAAEATDDLVAALQAAGADVARAGVIPQSTNNFFSVDTTRLTVNGQNVYVWEYGRSSEADAQAATVSPDGYEIGRAIVDWIGPPHFYRGTRIIVLYVGSDPGTLSLLEAALGPAFAGS